MSEMRETGYRNAFVCVITRIQLRNVLCGRLRVKPCNPATCAVAHSPFSWYSEQPVFQLRVQRITCIAAQMTSDGRNRFDGLREFRSFWPGRMSHEHFKLGHHCT